jgi:hypothetical protein
VTSRLVFTVGLIGVVAASVLGGVLLIVGIVIGVSDPVGARYAGFGGTAAVFAFGLLLACLVWRHLARRRPEGHLDR